MAELRIQNFLRNGGSLSDLREAPYYLQIKAEHVGDNTLVGFKYDQIKSSMGNKLVQECRGLILEMDTWNVVSLPFFKFFNATESHAASIDYSTARAFTKYDGTCCPIYFYDGKWRVQTLGTIDASGPVITDGFISIDFNGLTFSDLFWHAFDIVYPDFDFSQLDTNNTYIFELITPFNRIVTKYDSYLLPLIGVRNNETFDEFDISDFDSLFTVAESYSLNTNSIDAVLAMMNDLRSDEEGYVVVDGNFNRVKIKAPAYLALSRMKDGVINRRHGVLAIVLAEQDDDFVASYPEYADDVSALKASLIDMADWLEETYTRIVTGVYGTGEIDLNDPTRRKWFALDVQSEIPASFHGTCFKLLEGRISSVMEGIKSIDVAKVVKMIEAYDNNKN